MSRNRSMKTKKQRNGRRSAKKAASESAKPASRPTPSPEAPRQSSPTGILLRKVPHITRNLKARVRKLENKLDRYERCEKQLLEQLTAARDQIHQLNAAMYYVLHQPPHTGDYKDANYNNLFKPEWERFKWECPVARWDEHLRHIFHKDGCKKDEPDVEPGPETSRWAHE